MASLEQLIESFRNLQTKNSVTPDSLGYLLKELLDNHTADSTDLQSQVDALETLLSTGVADLNTIIETVKSTAESAKSKAETAQTTADTAKTTADAAKEVTDTKSQPNGIAPLDEDRQVPERYLPPSVFEVLEFDSVVDDSAKKITVIQGSASSLDGSDSLVWIDRGSSGEFAEFDGLRYYSGFSQRTRYVDESGAPHRSKLYRCMADGAIYAVKGGRFVRLYNEIIDAASRKVIDDVWVKLGGTITSPTTYGLNGLDDITFDEMLGILLIRPQGILANFNSIYDLGTYYVSVRQSYRTYLMPYVRTTSTWTYLNEAFRGQYNLEVIDVGNQNFYGALTNTFYGCSKLRKIIGTLSCQNANPMTGVFYGCAALEEVTIKGVRTDLDLQHCGKLNFTSFKYLVDNRSSTNNITVTVHPNVYAALTGEASEYPFNGGTKEQWIALLETAYSKNISFATV